MGVHAGLAVQAHTTQALMPDSMLWVSVPFPTTFAACHTVVQNQLFSPKDTEVIRRFIFFLYFFTIKGHKSF